MDYVVPGGVARDCSRRPASRRCAANATCSQPKSRRCATIYDEHAGLQDRFSGAGVVTPELAAQLGLTGLAGRASGQAFDLRVRFAVRRPTTSSTCA